jgi:hypothetical protein
MTTLRTQAEAETRAALEGIVVALDGAPLSAELALVPLRVYGDALRLGLEVPKPLRAWASACAPSLLDDVLRAAIGLVDGRIASAREAAVADPTTPTRLRERDHAESVVQAVRRTWLPRPLAQLAGHAELVARLARIDQAFATVLSRTDVTLLLGVRAGFGAAWAQAFTEATDAVDGDAPLPAILREARPSTGLVARYVESGAMSALIERRAAADPAFAEQLAETIEVMGTAGFAARSWQKKHAQALAAARAWTFDAPKLARAAASGDDAPAPIEHRLGALFPDVEAEATLFVGGSEITLEVDFEASGIARIELGSQAETPSATETSCRLVAPRSAGSLHLRIRARSGREISEELSFDSIDS